jgi:ankyrin repeat protein
MKKFFLVLLVFNTMVTAMNLPYFSSTRQKKQLGNRILDMIKEEYLKKNIVLEETIERIEFLIHSKADVNVVDQNHDTILHYAVKTQNIPIIMLLIKHKADLNKQNDRGNTPLHVAVELASDDTSVEITKLLLANGANVNLQSDRGDTPLMRAVIRQNVPLVRLLVGMSHPIHVLGKQGDRTHFSRLPLEIQKMAFAHVKADPNIRNKDKKTALDLAREALNHTKNDPEFFRNIDIKKRINDYEEMIKILEQITSHVVPQQQPQQQPQSQQSWWQRLWGR